MNKRMREVAWGRLADRLARLLEAGIPLLEALAFLKVRGKQSERLQTAEIEQRLRAGSRLSQALKEGKAPLMMQTLVEVGEQNGDLASSLLRSAEYVKERVNWQKERQQAMFYPLLVCVLLFLISLFLFGVVVPRFAGLYAGMGLKPGGGSQLIFALARFGPMGLLGGLSGFGLLFFISRKSRAMRRFWRQVWQRLPLIRQWVVAVRTHEWTATLGLLLEGGLPLLEALWVQEHLPLAEENKAVSARVRERISQGHTLGQSLQEEPFDEVLALAVQVAEQTGELARALLEMERDLASRRKQMMNGLLKGLEPGLLVFCGIMVGAVALLVLWPMLDLVNSI